MKLAVVSALFASAAHAVRVNQPTQSLGQSASVAQIQSSATQRMEAKLKLMDMDGLVSSALDEAKKAGTDQKAGSQDAAVSKDAEMKAVEAALAHRIIGRIAGSGSYGYGYIPTYPLAYPLHPEVGKAVAAVNAIHN